MNLIYFLVCVLLFEYVCNGQECNVTDKGAKGDGKHDDTKDIQSTINSSKCDIIYFPNGEYRVGTLILKKNKIYKMDDNASLIGDPSIDGYSNGVFYGNNEYNMTFIGVNINLIDASEYGNDCGYGYYMTGCSRLTFIV